MTPEHRDIPDWAQRERQGDLGWIAENLDAFSAIASVAFEDAGRGAIIVDTTSQPVPGAGHPFGYFSQDQIEELGDEDTSRMVAEYDPTQEFVVVLLKRDDPVSTYRVGIVRPESQEAGASEEAPGRNGEPTAEPELEPPDVETLIACDAGGGCDAACPPHCCTETHGTCPHGNPSWLAKPGTARGRLFWLRRVHHQSHDAPRYEPFAVCLVPYRAAPHAHERFGRR